MTILRIFLVLIASKDLEYYYFNIKNTFIELYLKKELYIKIPKEIYSIKNSYALRL